MICFLCTPFRMEGGGLSEIQSNQQAASRIAKDLVANGIAPIVPVLYLHGLLNPYDYKDREKTEGVAIKLLGLCDCVVANISRGVTHYMKEELKEAYRLGIPVYEWRGPCQTFDSPMNRGRAGLDPA